MDDNGSRNEVPQCINPQCSRNEKRLHAQIERLKEEIEELERQRGKEEKIR